MNTPAKLDPAALVAGQRVRLYCADIEREGIRQDRVWEFYVTNGIGYIFIIPNRITIRLTALDDGTLRDDEGRMVEVRDGE